MPIFVPPKAAATAATAATAAAATAAAPGRLPSRSAVPRGTRRRQSIDVLGHDAPREYRAVASFCSGDTLYTLLHVTIAWRAAALAELIALEPHDDAGEERLRRVLWHLCTARDGAAGETERRDNRAILARVLALTRAAKRVWVRVALTNPELVAAAAKLGDPQIMLILMRDERLVVDLALRVRLLHDACALNQPDMVDALLVGCPDDPPPAAVADFWVTAVERALSGGAPPNAAQTRIIRWCNATSRRRRRHVDLEASCITCDRHDIVTGVSLTLLSLCLLVVIIMVSAVVALVYIVTTDV